MSLICLALLKGRKCSWQDYQNDLIRIAESNGRFVRFLIDWNEPLLRELKYDWLLFLCDNSQWNNCENLLYPNEWDSPSYEAEGIFRKKMQLLQEITDYLLAKDVLIDWYLGTSGDSSADFVNFVVDASQLTNLLIRTWGNDGDTCSLHIRVLPFSCGSHARIDECDDRKGKTNGLNNRLLKSMELMGFHISWKLIRMGLKGWNSVLPILDRKDVIDYLYDILDCLDDRTEDAIALICEKDDPEGFDQLLDEMAEKDNSDFELQQKKWQICLLYQVLNSMKKDILYGLLELMEFWASMGFPEDAPRSFPSPEETNDAFFTEESKNRIVNENRKWADAQRKKIIQMESCRSAGSNK